MQNKIMGILTQQSFESFFFEINVYYFCNGQENSLFYAEST